MTHAGAMNQGGLLQSCAAFPQFYKALKAYRDSAEKIAPGENILWNKAKQAAASNVWAPKDYGAALNTNKAAMTEIGMQGSRVFAGTAMQEAPFKAELERLSTTNPISRIRPVADLLEKLAREREKELRGGRVNMPALQRRPQFPGGGPGGPTLPPAADVQDLLDQYGAP